MSFIYTSPPLSISSLAVSPCPHLGFARGVLSVSGRAPDTLIVLPIPRVCRKCGRKRRGCAQYSAIVFCFVLFCFVLSCILESQVRFLLSISFTCWQSAVGSALRACTWRVCPPPAPAVWPRRCSSRWQQPSVEQFSLPRPSTCRGVRQTHPTAFPARLQTVHVQTMVISDAFPCVHARFPDFAFRALLRLYVVARP
jgi:hypothetical protein